MSPSPPPAVEPAALEERSRAFEAEVLRWLPDVARFALALTHDEADADDLAQETFLRAFRSWHTFIPGSDARRWLFTICKHVFLRSRRRASRFVDVEDDAELDTLATVSLQGTLRRGAQDDLLERPDLGPAIQRAIAALPEQFRLAVVLVDVEGHAYEDAAAILEAPIGTVRSRLFRGRRLLQETLVEHARDAGFRPPRAPRSSTEDQR